MLRQSAAMIAGTGLLPPRDPGVTNPSCGISAAKCQYLPSLPLPILSANSAAWDSRVVVGNRKEGFQLIAQIHDRSRLAAIDGNDFSQIRECRRACP